MSGDLQQWWMRTAQADLDLALPKAAEYSASDLLVIGAGLVPDLSDSLRAEAAIAFYASGKTARIVGALIEGRTPNIDSWDDLSVYAMMGRRVREYGGWPGYPVVGKEGPSERLRGAGGRLQPNSGAQALGEARTP